MGIGGPLILGCSNVRITGEFPSFFMLHLMRLFRIPLRLEVSIKGLQGGGGVDSFVPLVITGFSAGRFG